MQEAGKSFVENILRAHVSSKPNIILLKRLAKYVPIKP